MKRYALSVIRALLLLLSCLALECKKDNAVAPPDNTFALTVDDASCTEVYLHFTLGASLTSRTVKLKRDTGVAATFTLVQTDTTVADTGLLPNRVYTYRADLTDGPAIVQSAGPLSAKTFDTTSSNFTFQTVTFGGNAGSCDLKDVAIINDTLAYAVGAIYLNDSTTGLPDPQPYNLAVWNGISWRLRKITVNFRGNMITVPLDGIFASSATHIWLIGGGLPIYGDGSAWKIYDLRATLDPGVSVSRGWGVNSQDMCFVGATGTIVRYTNGTWTSLTSGTTQTVQDIWGAVDPPTGKETILCAASHPLGYGDKEILSIDADNGVTSIPWPSQAVVMSVWFRTASFLYTCGAGIYRRGPDQVWREIGGPSVLNALTEHIRGQGNNDIFIAGDFGNIAHYNGASFRLYPEVTNTVGTNSVFRSCAAQNNMVVAVGFTSVGINTAAVIAVGKR